MMVVIHPRLAVVEKRWRNPLGAAVFAFSGTPAAGFDQAVVRSTGQAFVGDVGLSTVGPIQFGVMHLAAVARHRTPRERAAAVLGVQHNALVSVLLAITDDADDDRQDERTPS